MATYNQKQSIVELYVAWFNRVPDTAGLNYWIAQYDAGTTLSTISNQFYLAATSQFSAETGYTAGMSSSALITKLYEGVMGRTGSLAPTAQEIAYWEGKLATLGNNKGALVVQMVAEIKAFNATGNAPIKAVQDKFNNKMYVAEQLALVNGYAGTITDAKAILNLVTDNTATIATALNAAGVNTSANTFTLTNRTDIATAAIFNAGLVYSPGGNDRINSLQNEDRLTGTSAATDSLNVTIGNRNDNGNVIITPTMTSIEIANVVMSHNDGTALDLQDAAGLSTVNVTRIASGGSNVQNMQGTVTTLSVANTQEVTDISFTYLNGELAGTNTVGLTLSNVNAGTLLVGAKAVQSEQIETVNLTSAVASTANTVDLQSDALVTTAQRLNIIATSSFRVGSDIDGDGNIIEHNNGFSNDTLAGLNNITITGAGNVTLGSVTRPSTNGDAVAEQAFTLDASAATGAIAVNIANAAALGDNLTATSMFITGSGNDTVVSQTTDNGAGNDLLGDVVTGAGNDSVTIRANVITDQNNNHFASIDTGEGDDTVTVTGNITGGVAGGATITTGAGNDTMTLGVANTVGGAVANLGEEASINMGAGNDTLTMTATTAGDTGGLDADFLGSSIDMGAGDDTVIFDLTGKADQGLLIGGTLAGGEGANTLTITGNASVANVANFDPTPDADSVTGFATLNAISEQSYDAAIVAAVNAIQPGMITANDVNGQTADYTVDASEFTGLTAINFTNQAGITTPLAVEGTTANRFEGDAAVYTVNNYEAQTITVNTVEALTGAAGSRLVPIAATYNAANNVEADAILRIANANIATGATDSATSAATVVIAGEGDVAIDDTSVAGTGVVDDIEVLNLTVNGAASRSVILAADDFETTMTMGGDTTGTITLTNVEATTFTSTIAGNVNVTVLTSENKTITTGAGNDVINLLADVVNVSDIINLGTGTDRIIINDDIRGTGADADENFDNISGVEELEVRGDGGATLDVTLDDDAFTTGISRVVLAQDAGVDANVDLDIGVDFNRALTIDMAAESTLDIDNDANVNTTINMRTTGSTSDNRLTFTDAGTGTVALNITVDALAQTISNAGTAANNDVIINNNDVTGEIDSITLLDSNRVSATNIAPPGNQLVVGEDQTGVITLILGAAWAQAGDTVTVNASDINDDDRTDGGVLTNTDNQTVVINAAAANYSVNITGSQMVDTITGTNRADTIDGQAGNDVITGGDGVDTLTGGAGADTFVYTSFTNSNSDSTDTITDFVSGTDKISVSLTAIAGEVVNLGRFASVTTSGAGDDSLGGTSTSGSKVVGDAYYSSTGKLAIDVDGNGDITSSADIVINSATAVAAGDINYTVTGTAGADTIRAGQGADTINGGSGDDIIVMVGALTAADVNNYAAAGNIGAITANAEVQKVVNYTELTTVRTATEVNTGDTLDGQGGTDTLHVFGTTDLTLINAGAALNVENLVIHSTTTLSAAQLAALTSIVLQGNTPHTVTVTGSTAAAILAKMSFVGAGTGTTFTITGVDGVVTATWDAVSGRMELASSTAVSVAYAPDTPVITVMQVVPTVNVATAATTLTAYHLQDTAANLAAATASILNNATNITATTQATVAQATTIVNATNLGANTYHLQDTAANLAGAAAAVGNGATTITATTAATVAQATAIEAFTNTGTNTYNITDSAANLAASTNAVLTLAGTVTANTAATVAQAIILDGFSKAVSFSVSDTAAAVAAATSANLDEATSITVTGQATVVQGIAIQLLGHPSVTFNVTDTASAIAAALPSSVTPYNHAATITASTAATAAQARTIAADAKAVVYSVSDTAANLAASPGAGGQNNSLNEAVNLVATTAATLAEATIIEAAVNTGTNTYNITDSAANLAASTNAVLTLAGTVTANTAATVAQAIILDGFAKAVSFNVVDTATEIAASNADTNYSEAGTITASSAASAAEAATIAGYTKAVTFDTTDTVANLATNLTGANLTEARAVGTVTASDLAAELATALTTNSQMLGYLVNSVEVIDVNDAGALTLTPSQFANFMGGTVTLEVDEAVAIVGGGAVNLGTLSSYGGNGVLTLSSAATNDVYTVNLGTSGVHTINWLGTGDHDVTASSSVTETFVLGAGVNGGFLRGLTLSDRIDVDGANAIAPLNTNTVYAANVDAAREWNFNTGVLTWYDSVANATVSVALVGVTNVMADNSDVFTIV